jgi:isopentenyl diphosphate isomerase/L-lactate dehydrogenase-like FMN-dependent dehydrogenase
MAQGADSGEMLSVNRRGFDAFRLRPRRLSGVTNPDLSVEIFGSRYDLPIFLAPCGGQGSFHPDGEVAVGRAARSRNALQILSTVTNESVEDVTQARGAPIWFQLYPTADWDITRGMVERAERAGCTALVLTVDLPARNLEASTRLDRDNNPACQACHTPGIEGAFGPKPMFDGIDMNGIRMSIAGLTWDYVDRLRNATSMQILLKGIVTGTDARLAMDRGVDGLIVSNHGGRVESSNRSTIASLSEVVDVVDGRVPVLVDSGFRRGTDIYKALALGADAICIGRPYLWGLGSFGAEGVERILDILGRELSIVMTQMGAPSIAAIDPGTIEA